MCYCTEDDLYHDVFMQAEGVPLASNQVQYSLLYRTPETNGVAEAVKEAGATLVSTQLLLGARSCYRLPSKR